MVTKIEDSIWEINTIIQKLSADKNNLEGYIVFDRVGGLTNTSGILIIIMKPYRDKIIKSKIKSEAEIFKICDTSFIRTKFIEEKSLIKFGDFLQLNKEKYILQTPVIIGRLNRITKNLEIGYITAQNLRYEPNDPQKSKIEIFLKKKDSFFAAIQILDLKEAGIVFEQEIIPKEKETEPVTKKEKLKSETEKRIDSQISGLSNSELSTIRTSEAKVSVGFMNQQRMAYESHKKTMEELEEERDKLKAQIKESNNELRIKKEDLNATKKELEAVKEDLKTSKIEINSKEKEIKEAKENIDAINKNLDTKKEELTRVTKELDAARKDIKTKDGEIIGLQEELDTAIEKTKSKQEELKKTEVKLKTAQ
ncbi:MAG: hypothetical protein ACTSWY_11350, partial [Promethearchaeota archaeon]